MSSVLWNCPLQEKETSVFVLQLASFMSGGLPLGTTPHPAACLCTYRVTEADLTLSGFHVKGHLSLHTLT